MKGEKIRVALAEDHDILREKYASMISLETDMELLGVAKSYQEIVDIAEKMHPDVIVMDVEMDANDAGIRATAHIFVKHPDIRIIMLTVHDDRENIICALNAGACGYVLKEGSSAFEIIQSIRKAYYNAPHFSSEVLKTMISEVRNIEQERKSLMLAINIMSNLTKTELAILMMIHEGKTQREICEIRCIELSTMKSHIKNILRKFGKSRMKSVLNEIEAQDLFPYLSNFVNKRLDT